MMNALEIRSGADLLEFEAPQIVLDRTRYSILTGHEGTGRCFWCGGELRGKLKRYCRGHMVEYYRHFEWGSARNWCCKRQDGICANCGARLGDSLEVHHIVPLNGGIRYFSAFNLPWNLIGFCHNCHQEIHAVMRPPRSAMPAKAEIDSWERARQIGQGVFELCLE